MNFVLMGAITDDRVRKWWAVAVVLVALSVGGAAWTTNITRDIGALQDADEAKGRSLEKIENALSRIEKGLIKKGIIDPEGGR